MRAPITINLEIKTLALDVNIVAVPVDKHEIKELSQTLD